MASTNHGAKGVADQPSWGERSKMRLLDHDVLRVDAGPKLTGEARYSHDMRLPGMVWARLVTCPVPHAFVAVDLEPALALPGVVAALLVREGETQYVGQAVAVVAAETVEQVHDAARAVVLEIEELPWAVTPEQALAPDAPSVSDRGNLRPMGEDGDRDAAEAALADAEGVVDATYTCPIQHHVCLETHGVVVDFNGGDEATVYASTQATFGPIQEAETRLGLEAGQVRCVVEYMGGGFGSKFSLDIPGQHACRVAKEIGRPVHLLLDRPQEFALGGNRSGSVQHLVGGLSAEGEFVALVSEMTKLGGIGRGPGTRQPYIYRPANSWTSHSSLHTHTDSSRAMRAPGHPQASFAIESLLDELA
jgi:xanthine dehydrogenase YagR molybdenum-binding subunit